MTTRARRPLNERVLNYPDDAPQDETTLINTEVRALRDLGLPDDQLDVVLEHRRSILDAIRAHGRRAIPGPEALLELINGSRLIRPVAYRWLTYPLNGRKERLLVPHPENPGEMRYLNVLSQKVPATKRLNDEAALPMGGKYLLIYGGSPDVLSEGTTAAEIARLRAETDVADVTFWHLVKGQPGTLYSLAKGQGDRAGEAVAFPDQKAFEEARRL